MSASAIHGLQAAISTVKAAYPVEQHAGLHQALNGAMQASQNTLHQTAPSLPKGTEVGTSGQKSGSKLPPDMEVNPKTLKGATNSARKMFQTNRGSGVSSGGG